jgi:hypothetical protein
VTLELALAGVPMVVAYRISPLSAFLVRRMGVSVEHASLVNLLVGREVAPECLQEECTPENLAARVDEILGSEQVRARQRQAFKDVTKALGDRNPRQASAQRRVVPERSDRCARSAALPVIRFSGSNCSNKLRQYDHAFGTFSFARGIHGPENEDATPHHMSRTSDNPVLKTAALMPTPSRSR